MSEETDLQPKLDPENGGNGNAVEGEIKDTEYGKIKSRGIELEMQDSYLDYAMSVIVARALPDVRDGLKPVHRRVLYSMHELGLTSHAKYRKSATVVGDVLGKYHPHGDIAVYDSLVRMAQPFAMRYRLVDGQGNFGSMDGDSAAAMRYTEARMTAMSEDMLSDIEKNTVEFIPNYDGSRQEPTVLPAKVPQLLLNGSLGIAVGMATNIPPHNLTELCDGIIHLVDNPEAQVEDLMGFIPGPDFPTGANIYNQEEIKTAYVTGKGRVDIRATANIEETSRGFRIIVSQIPYQVNKSDLILKIADLVKNKKIEGISDLRDESDRKDGVRIVIELKANAYPKKILNRLFELTSMQTAFHVNMLALIGGIEPKVLSLKNILEEFISHRRVVVRRRTEFELNQAKDRAHILEGLKKALDHIDEIIALIKKSETKDAAHKNLMQKFSFSERQATAILEMKLSALAGLERKKIEDELETKKELIAKLEDILASEKKILLIIKEELVSIKEKHGDERRTKIYKSAIGEFTAEDLIPNEQVIVSLTKGNYIKRVSEVTYKSQGRGGKGVIGMVTKEEDTVEHLITCFTHDSIMFFTDRGRVFTTKVYDLPASSRTAKGQAIVNIIQIAQDEKVTAILIFSQDKQIEKPKYLFMATRRGVVKKTDVAMYQNVRKTGLIAIKLNSGDELKWVVGTSGNDNIMMVTRKGQGIQFNESDVRSMGRSAAGVRGIRLKPSDEVISTNVIKDPSWDLIGISSHGLGKRSKISLFGVQHRGGYGLRAAKITARTGDLVGSKLAIGDKGDVVVISSHGQIIRLPLKSIKRLGRDTQGVTLMRLNKDDVVSSLTLIQYEEVETVKDAKENKNDLNDKNSQDKNMPKEKAKIIKPTQEMEIKKIDSAKSKITKSQKVDKIVEENKKQSSVNVQHYQSQKKKDSSEPNYWGADIWKKKKL